MDPLGSFTSHAVIAGIMCHPDVSHALKVNMNLNVMCVYVYQFIHINIHIIYILYHIIMIDKHTYHIYIYTLFVSKNVGTGCHVFCACVRRISFHTLVLDDMIQNKHQCDSNVKSSYISLKRWNNTQYDYDDVVGLPELTVQVAPQPEHDPALWWFHRCVGVRPWKRPTARRCVGLQ